MYLIGYDIGSSSIKVALVDAQTGETMGVVQHPETEMDIMAVQPGWAEQNPEMWWDNACLATKKLLKKQAVNKSDIIGIGIAYQMHGLVLVDKDQEVLRPSIIWCDSRAVETGNQAFEEMGPEKCLMELLNSPGNFTASKLKWVKENEPEVYSKIHKMMLPGDYIAMKMTGEIVTTASGLSEGILWDFKKEGLANSVLDHYGIEKSFIPKIVPTFSNQGTITDSAAEALGLSVGTIVGYRAGDQPNNALCLNVFNPGEIAATGGTSGVVYGIVDKAAYDPLSRVNCFAHVNHEKNAPRIGVLLCINGAGSQYNWVNKQIAQADTSYPEMENMATNIAIGSDGLRIHPFGNGAERMLANQDLGASIRNLNFNRHGRPHLFRAALEGIAFSFVYGIRILKEMGLDVGAMRVGNDNLFQSKIFSDTIATLIDSRIQVVETTGAVGAAKASGIATGDYETLQEALEEKDVLFTYEPLSQKELYENAYQQWEADLNKLINS